MDISCENLKLLNNTPFFAQTGTNYEMESGSILNSISLNSINFSVRFINVLSKTNIVTLLELVNTNFEYLLSIKNCGKKCINDAREKIIFHVKNLSEKIDSENYSLKQENLFVNYPFLGDISKNEAETIDKHLNDKLYFYEFPIRFNDYLAKNPGIKTVNDLFNIEVNKLLEVKNLGKGTLISVKKLLLNAFNSQNLPNETKNNPLDIIDNYILGLDQRTKEIIMLRWNNDKIVSYKQIGLKYNLTRERVRQIIEKNLEKLKKIFHTTNGNIKEAFLDIILSFPFPIKIDLLENKPLFRRVYSKYFYLGILSTLFEEVTFEGYSKKNFEQYVRYSSNSNKFSFYYFELQKIEIPLNSITPQKLLDLIHPKSTQDALYLFSTVFNTKNLFFKKFEGIYFLNQITSLQETCINILKSSDKPLELSKILEIIKYNFSYDNKYDDTNSVIGNIKQNSSIYELDKHVFGLIEHFSYTQNLWEDINTQAKIIMMNIGRQSNAVELFESLQEIFPKLRSKYELVYILRNNDDIEDLGFFNFALKSMGIDERITIKGAIEILFESNLAPKHFSEIQQKVSEKRFSRIEGINTSLKALEFLEYYSGGFWGLKMYDSDNLSSLAENDIYISKIISYEIFPNTSLERILKILGGNHFEQRVLSTIKKSKQLDLYDGIEIGPFVISRKWSIIKLVRCILFHFNRELYWDELLWILKDFNFVLDSNSKSKIRSDKNVRINGNKLSYFEVRLEKNDMKDVAEICYEILAESDKQESLDYIHEVINNEYIEITKYELLHLIKNESRFLIIDEQLIMVK